MTLIYYVSISTVLVDQYLLCEPSIYTLTSQLISTQVNPIYVYFFLFNPFALIDNQEYQTDMMNAVAHAIPHFIQS